MSESKGRTSWTRPLFLLLSAAAAVAVVLAAREVLLPFVLALVIAYVLTPFVAWFERKGLRRSVAIVAAYAVVLGSLAGFLWAIAPRIGRELGGLRKELPALSERANNEWAPRVQAKLKGAGLVAEGDDSAESQPEHGRPAIVLRPMGEGKYALEVGSGVAITEDEHGYVVQAQHDEPKGRFDLNRAISASLKRTLDYARSNALELAKLGRDIVAGISRVIFIFGITLMLAAYLILTRERVVDTFRSLARPASRPSFDAFLARVDRGLSGVVRGQLIICLVNGVLSAIGFAAVGLKYWPIVALIATVFSLVPIFGSIASSVPAVALGLTQGPGTALFVLLWIIGIHQIEANFLNPKIMGDAAKIHPVLVIFSLLVGEHFFHTAGALLAVPCMSITLSVFQHFRAIAHASDPAFAEDPRPSEFPPPLPGAEAGAGPGGA
ncbi:MAG: AI-2E family transporter [Myxococcales bacterium]|nr:AI-2E family transporter [Myxococcales bacterium]HQY63255.1 AI-2E family transporter [Polyangiaceae bacterium]